MDACFPGKIRLKKIRWDAKQDYEFVDNYKELQQAFDKLRINKHIEVNKLIRAKYQDNLEFMQWMKSFHGQNASGTIAEYSATGEFVLFSCYHMTKCFTNLKLDIFSHSARSPIAWQGRQPRAALHRRRWRRRRVGRSGRREDYGKDASVAGRAQGGGAQEDDAAQGTQRDGKQEAVYNNNKGGRSGSIVSADEEAGRGRGALEVHRGGVGDGAQLLLWQDARDREDAAAPLG